MSLDLSGGKVGDMSGFASKPWFFKFGFHYLPCSLEGWVFTLLAIPACAAPMLVSLLVDPGIESPVFILCGIAASAVGILAATEFAKRRSR